ncbi:MAG: hypothetical protein ACMUIG_07885, partial [Thermoplasmatota archaeon]
WIEKIEEYRGESIPKKFPLCDGCLEKYYQEQKADIDQRLPQLDEERKRREEKKERAKRFLIKTIDRTENTASRTLDAASDLTVVGFKAVKNGVKRSEYIIIFAGDKIEKVIQVPKGLMKNKGNRKTEKKLDPDEDEPSLSDEIRRDGE